MKRLILLSNSTNHGAGYLDHAMADVRELLGRAQTLLFVPFALKDRTAYTTKVADRLAREGVAVEGLEDGPGAAALVDEADAIFVGGGNTFRLLDALQRNRLLAPIRERVLGGMPYIGASAGTNIAAPTIRTTNDMPIVQPASFDALGLVPFQINPHYVDPEPGSTHMGETRADRIREFLEENETPVMGLREGSWLNVTDAGATLRGPHPARLFVRGCEPVDLPPGTNFVQAPVA